MVNTNNLAVGQSVKDNSEKEQLVCENETCKKVTEPLFGVQVGNKEKKYCQACYQQYWLERGYRV